MDQGKKYRTLGPNEWTVKNTILFVLASIFISCSTPLEKLKELPPKQQRSALAEIGREALVNALREVEGQTPISFLKINQASVRPIEQVVQRATLFRSAIKKTVGHTFEGSIQNNALVANFKNLKVIIYYDAANGSKISQEELTVFQTIRAGKSVNFSAEINEPDQTSSYRYIITEAARAN